ncbi:hypothetical protein AGMMS50239_07430 [Bacteroidia bacterium]|nr:hypothetical protein AGMMS50239_07430 [Bacteroidia bacterium]
MNNIIKTAVFLLLAFAGISACKEEGRFDIALGDKTPPQAPEYIRYEPLYGGARLFYKIPDDEDLLSIDASYTNGNGATVWASRSYFVDSLDVKGFADTIDYVVQLYATDKAGNKSASVPVTVRPKESVVSSVSKTVTVKPSFGALMVSWENSLTENVNVSVDFSFTENGALRSFHQAYSSRTAYNRRFISDLNLSSQISVQVTISDVYGNTSAPRDMGQMSVLSDTELPKSEWTLPFPNDTIGGVPMGDGTYESDARIERVYDGLVNKVTDVNYAGFAGLPWNLFIDLGAEYELSRIRTHQRRIVRGVTLPTSKGSLYAEPNVGRYNMYRFDSASKQWVFINEVRIPIPDNLSEQEVINLGTAGDLAVMFPDEPGFTPPTRWFRFEALNSFANGYTGTDCPYLSEITLYGRKAN